MMQRRIFKLSRSLAAMVLAWLLPLFAWAPLTYPGYFEFHSGFLPIFNLNDLLRHLTDFSWAATVGQPHDLLRGERALPYLLAALPRAMGASPVVAVKWIFGASLLAGSLGMYGWARRRLGPWPALLAATVYVYGPILLATTYVRGAFAEALLLGLLPWVLWAADAARAGRRTGAVGLALGLAAALWTQTGLALWLAMIVLMYGLALARSKLPRAARPPLLKQAAMADESRLQPAGLALVGWAGGLALGALGLLPVALRHGWGGATHVSFADHFVYPHQLLLAGWGAGPSIPGPYDTLTFSVGVVALGLAALAWCVQQRGFALVRGPSDPTHADTHAAGDATTGENDGGSVGDRPQRVIFRAEESTQYAIRNTQRFATLIALILALLSTTLAVPFWQLLPFLARTLTYPWQLLLLVGPWLAWLAGLGGRALLALWPGERQAHWIVPLFAGLLTLTLLGAYNVPLNILSQTQEGNSGQPLNPPALSVPAPDAPMAIFGDGEIALLSAVIAGPPGPGGRVTALVRWQALRPLDQDYTVFFHALGPDGNRWGQQDIMPQGGKLPTSQWRPGQVVQDQYQLTLAPNAPIGGDYRYLLGMYQWQTGQRLTTGTDDKVILTP